MQISDRRLGPYGLHQLRSKAVDFSFILPCLLFFIAFVVVPFVQGIPLSLTDWDGIAPTKNFVGLYNYKKLLTDRNMSKSIINTLVFTGYQLVFCNLIGLGCALLLHKALRFNNLIRLILFMPFTISLILSSYMWRYVYNDLFYSTLGILNPLTRPSTVMTGISIIGIWRVSGYCMVIYIAALQGISEDYYEYASIEGAGKWKTFTKITLPMIVPAITSNVTLLISWSMKVYDYPMAATGGGPGTSSFTLAMLVYHNLFQYSKAGYGQAIAVVFTVIVCVFSGTVTRAIRSREVEL